MPHESLTPRPSRCIFVYGTLRRGGSNDITRLEPAAQFIGPARVAGVLYHLGSYPGMTLGGGQWVQGEVYAIEPALESLLDEIEDLGANPTDEYIKRDVLLEVQGLPMRCLVYEINSRYVASALVIGHGDWLKSISDSERG